MKYLLYSIVVLAYSTSFLRAADPAPPQVLVPGWEISLFSAEPDIVTPIGIAVDGTGRVFVAESHTHQAKPGYPGPKSDRIKIFEDTNGDGRADKVSLFAEGFTAAMNLAFGPDGVLHLVHRNGVVRLEDHDKDGVCDKQVPLLTLDTKEVYPHNGLSGIAFTPDGWIYVGSGENFGTLYTANARDGTQVSYTPGGANVFRMRLDGSRLEVVATGMWNAFVLTADGAGRVFALDNDPDSLPPCRFLHVVKGADFGYQFQYGRSGLHPFVCWNGELPGTLPMMAGTGEAPTGILDARLAKLGPDRGEGYLMTEWGDNTLSWFRLQPQGASFTATREVVIRGDAAFRPACLAEAPDGSVYLTDWADREYSVHQKGRIWHLKATEPDKTPANRSAPPLTEAEQRRDRLASATDPAAWTELKAALTDPDPFIVSAALTALKLPGFQPQLLAEFANPESTIRLGCLLALRRAGYADPASLLRQALADPDAAVRRTAMIWAAERRLKELRPLVEKALEAGGPDQPISQEDFAVWLAAMDLIARDTPPTAATASASNDDLLQKLLADPTTSPGIKAAVIPRLTNFKAPAMIRTLMSLATTGDPKVRQEAVRSLAFVSVKAVVPILQKIAFDENEDLSLREDAISAFANRPASDVLLLIKLLEGADSRIALGTARILRPHVSDPVVKKALESACENNEFAMPLFLDFVALALGKPPLTPRPSNDEEWTKWLMADTEKGNARNGRHVFFSATAMCSSCHVAEGRGVTVGPDLGTIARSSDRAKLIQSMLEPSREIGPLYGTKAATLKDGTVVSGVQSIKDGGGNLNLLQTGGVVIPVPRDQIVKVDETPVSLMPEGLELGMTVQDFRDLLAYLETLK